MKKRLLLFSLVLIGLLLAIAAFLLFGSATGSSEKSRYLYIPSDKATFDEVYKTLSDSGYISSPSVFKLWADVNNLSQKIKPGRYEIKQGTNVYDMVRMLKNGKQSPVKLIITKFRTTEQVAAFLGRKFEADSAAFISFMNNADSIQTLGLDTDNFLTCILPNTYEVLWNSGPGAIFRKLQAAGSLFWNETRKGLAARHGLDMKQVYILASIVEEETNAEEEKGKIASVYINRFRKGMRLQADPTVKFALKDFMLKRIYEKHLAVVSPYNTYRNSGLPPGPICIPSLKSIEAVLQAPETGYLYFVAKSDFSGRHEFSETYEQHLIYAKAFSKAQDEQQKIKKANEAIEQAP